MSEYGQPQPYAPQAPGQPADPYAAFEQTGETGAPYATHPAPVAVPVPVGDFPPPPPVPPTGFEAPQAPAPVYVDTGAAIPVDPNVDPYAGLAATHVPIPQPPSPVVAQAPVEVQSAAPVQVLDPAASPAPAAPSGPPISFPAAAAPPTVAPPAAPPSVAPPSGPPITFPATAAPAAPPSAPPVMPPTAPPSAPPVIQPVGTPLGAPLGAPLGGGEDLPPEFDTSTPTPMEVVHPMELPAGRPALERLLAALVMHGGSDMHLDHGQPPRFRVGGALLPVGGESPLYDEDLHKLLSEALTPQAWKEFTENKDLDTAYQMDQALGSVVTSRFRINLARSMGHITAVMRVIPTKIVTLDELGMAPQVNTLATLPQGLVLLTGATGSGKSTTLAGLVDLINTTRTERIWTFEDPIEFVHQSKKSLISHREIGEDTPSFAEGLRRVRRQDPDIILIGEMRDYETIDAAIEAADTGHLVLATLHTNSAADTISRIINVFPPERQEQVRITLASVLEAIICQKLVPSPSAPRGRVLAHEIMMVTPAIRNNIRENDIPAIHNALVDQSSGSISFDAHLTELVKQKKITKNEAYKKALDREQLKRLLGDS